MKKKKKKKKEKKAYQITRSLGIMHMHNLCRRENGKLLRAFGVSADTVKTRREG